MGQSFWRTILGAMVILPFVWRPMMLQMDLIKRNIVIIAVLAFLLIIGGNATLFISLQYTIAINAGVLNSFEPVLILIVAWAIFRDPVTLFQAIGVAISLLGVLTLIGRGDWAVLMSLDLNKGDILVLGAYTSWAFYAVYLRKAPRGLDPKVMLFLILVLGSAMQLPIYVVEAVFDRPTNAHGTTILIIVVLSLFSSVISVFLWNYALVRLGAGRAAIFIQLIVAFTVVLAILFLGERWEWFHGVGVALILIGIYLSTIRGKTQVQTSGTGAGG
jgi:drug/metabolite transporter (DMT)-like permease